MNSNQENIKPVLRWIVDILNELNIPFHVTGGLAAIAYGASRPIYDIDIDIPEDQLQKLFEKIIEYVTFGPGNFKDPDWDLTMMTVRYEDVSIDISGAYTGKIFDKKVNKWVPYDSDLKYTVQKEILGMTLPVISRDILINYKRLLARPTDLQDIDAMEANFSHYSNGKY